MVSWTRHGYVAQRQSANLLFEIFEISKWLWPLVLYHVKTPLWCCRSTKESYGHPSREHEISQGIERTLAELTLFFLCVIHLAHRTQDRNEKGIVFRNSAWQNGSYPSHSYQTSQNHAQKIHVFYFSPDLENTSEKLHRLKDCHMPTLPAKKIKNKASAELM